MQNNEARKLRESYAVVDLEALSFNASNIKKKTGSCQPMAVLKADAYGHGIKRVLPTLLSAGYKNFAAATVEEVLAIREMTQDARVLLLTTAPKDALELLSKNHITLMLSSLDEAKALSEFCQANGAKLECFAALDTGMSRLGFQTRDLTLLSQEIKSVSEFLGLILIGLHSHFATSDEADKEFTYKQLEIFNRAYDAITEAGVKISYRAIANSAAIIDVPEALEMELCRPGFILYGIYPSDEVHKENLAIKNTMSVRARIIFLNNIETHDTVGYGRKFTAKRQTRVGVLHIGFADGLPRGYSGKGKVIINGKFAPIIGNICMDQCMIDITDFPEVDIGTEVIIMGSDGNLSISPEEICSCVEGMVVDELLIHFGQRLPIITKG